MGFSHSLGQKLTCAPGVGGSAFTSATDLENADQMSWNVDARSSCTADIGPMQKIEYAANNNKHVAHP
jgi:hypothetical protein